VKRITVIPPGARVGIRVPEIADAVVLEVHIGPGLVVSYECRWWEGAEMYTARLEAHELDANPPEKLRVGFGV
jgi:uncharacterized protein YodC (DUF2158 family)